MKIAIILGEFSVGPRPLDFTNIWTSTRGLTGTDLATVMISKELQKLGHDVSLFTLHTDSNAKLGVWENVNVYHYRNRFAIINDSFDAVVSINEPDSLRDLNTKAFKICWQFLNDFNFCKYGFDNLVDLWLSPSQMLLDYLVKLGNLNKDKWRVLPLGCDPSLYEDKRVPGRVIWMSSADRGLHWLIQEWPAIKKAVPNATLKVFYHFGFDHLIDAEQHTHNIHPHVLEMAQRLRYIRESIKKLKPLGVEHVGSTSRVDLAKEVSEASVFAYCTDTVSFSEGFSVSTLENLAGFTVPIVSDVDCLGSVYKDSGAVVVKSPIRDNLDEFRNAVIKGLTDKKHADSVIDKCRAFAQKHSWSKIAEQLQDIINENKNR
jgi:glycosyltransferase involved in cell wall biosynthesis